jgi:hypothetical protein
MEGQGTEVLTTCLMVLGYLSLHTRQINMIMSNRRCVSFYREKIGKEIDERPSRESSNQRHKVLSPSPPPFPGSLPRTRE